jgi:hypothetical protein
LKRFYTGEYNVKTTSIRRTIENEKKGNITDYDSELDSYRDEKYGYKDIEENNIQEVNKKLI